MSRTTWNFFTAGQICFGPGAILGLGDHLHRLRVNNALVITDQQLVKAGVLDRVLASLRGSDVDVTVFDGGEPEPAIQVAVNATEVARQCIPDTIIGLGGGSNMDLSKLTATMFTHGGAAHDYFGFNNIPGPILPLICIPTTAGTGSEVSRAAVLTDTENHMKVSSLSNHIRPTLALIDPTLTRSCPAKPTADSGIDALTHAIEAYMAKDSCALPLAPGEPAPYEGRYLLGMHLAEKAIELIGTHLRTAVAEPENLEAREGMALAALIAGMSFSNCGVTIVHALEYPLGGSLHCSHGAGNGLLLPHVMRYNKSERLDVLPRIAELLGEEVSGMEADAAANKAIAAVERLCKDVGIPQRIRDLGGSEEQLPDFATKAFAIKRLMDLNPKPPTEADIFEIYNQAF